MSEPHFHEEQIVERVRPARTRRVVTERRQLGGLDGRPGLGGLHPLALVLAVGLVVFILVLVFGYLV